MKRMKYTDAIDQISVSQEKQDEVWKQIEKRVEQKGRVKIRKTRRAAAAAAVIACAVTVSGVAFADEIEEFFTGFLTKNEIIQSDVQENVFSDSDGHVRVEIAELLSDGVIIQATVKYQALDETGRNWLDDYDTLKPYTGVRSLIIEPDIQEAGDEYAVGYSCGCREVREYQTENERIFFLRLEAIAETPALEQVHFCYDMTDGEYTATLDTPANVPVFEYELTVSDNGSANEQYTPTVLRISKLSYIVYGLNQGYLEEFQRMHEDESLTDEERAAFVEDRIIKRIWFKEQDGEWFPVHAGTSGGALKEALADEKKDMVLSSGPLVRIGERFYNPIIKDVELDPANIAGFRIEDVEYDAVAAEP